MAQTTEHEKKEPRSRITAQDAHEAYRRLVEGKARAPVGDRPGDADLLREVGRELFAWKGANAVFERCPACWAEDVRRIYGSDHYPYCDHHPAYARLRAAHDAAALAPDLGGRPGVAAPELPARPPDLAASVRLRSVAKAPQRRWPPRDEREADRQIRVLVELGEGREGDAWDAAQEPAAPLGGMVREWAHVHHREVDPCPFCKAVVPIDELRRHLLGCEAHPAHRAAREVEEALRAAVGPEGAALLLRLAAERNAFRDATATLLAACEKYDGEMGWGGDCAYSKSWSEEPWLAAQKAAEAVMKREARADEGGLPAGDAPGRIAAVRSEAARMREALAALLEVCRKFWSGMGDDGRRSVIYNHLVPDWKAGRQAAREALAEVT